MKKYCLVTLVALAISSLWSPTFALAENTATNPVPRIVPDSPARNAKWISRHEGFVQQARQGGINVLFMGDSITDHWRDRGSNVWNQYYAPMQAADFGISGDRTQHVLWRMDNGELNGIHPKVVVLMIGTNNTGKEQDHQTIRNTPPQVIEGVTAIVNDLRAKLPKSKILLLGIFPRDKPDSPFRDEIKEINAGLVRLGDDKLVTYLDIGPEFLAPDGTLLPGAMRPDNLHPTEKGYKIWAKAMNPTLDAMRH